MAGESMSARYSFVGAVRRIDALMNDGKGRTAREISMLTGVSLTTTRRVLKHLSRDDLKKPGNYFLEPIDWPGSRARRWTMMFAYKGSDVKGFVHIVDIGEGVGPVKEK